MNNNFEIKMLEEARTFIKALPDKARDKVAYTILKAQKTKNPTVFKKLSGHDIWELRTSYNGQSYRLFAFWDKHTKALVVATHGLDKKTQKTPPHEIEKAERLMKQYYKYEYNEQN